MCSPINLVDVRVGMPWELPGFTPDRHNLLRIFGGRRDADSLPGAVFIVDQPVGYRSPPPYAAPVADPLLRLPTAVETVDEVDEGERFDPRPAAESPAVDAGDPAVARTTDHPTANDAPDLGAFESGEEEEEGWLPLRVGPRWDRRAIWRAFTPASLRHAAQPTAHPTARPTAEQDDG